MKSRSILIGVIALAIVGAGAFLLLNRSDGSETSNTQTAQTQEAEINAPAGESSTAGTYVNYSEDALASANGTKVLFFHAPWCPQCRQLDADIKDGGIPDNTTILKVDYDSNQALRQRYGVTIQTTFVTVDENGNQIKKYTAYEKPTLDNVVSNLGL